MNREYVIMSPFFSVHDRAVEGEQKPEMLGRYFDDIYKMFLRNLGTFEASASFRREDVTKLKALFLEVLRVKEKLSQKE